MCSRECQRRELQPLTRGCGAIDPNWWVRQSFCYVSCKHSRTIQYESITNWPEYFLRFFFFHISVWFFTLPESKQLVFNISLECFFLSLIQMSNTLSPVELFFSHRKILFNYLPLLKLEINCLGTLNLNKKSSITISKNFGNILVKFYCLI